jgi:periplasmic mercuric ion binding protein
MRHFILFLCFFSVVSFSIAQSGTKTESFKVYGNCGTCKSNIEGSLKKKDGVIKKDWDKDTKILTVTYDPAKINLLQIKQKVADAGYDSEEVRAKDEAYFKLHKCCQYDRPKKN